MAGTCVARDADGQRCAKRQLHLGAHQHTGLRRWLDAAAVHGRMGTAIIRAYDGARANELEAMETPLFASYGFTPIAREGVIQTKTGGLNTGAVFFLGIFAPSEKVSFRFRVVCFAQLDGG